VPHGIKGSTPSCEREGCESKAIARGLCGMHYKRQREAGDPGPVGRYRPANPPECRVPDCPGKPKGHGLCEMHGARQRRTGRVGSAEKRKPRGQCQAPGCDKPHQARGFCEQHYRQVLCNDPERIKRHQAAAERVVRTCSECKLVLPLATGYYRDKGGAGGYRSNCKDCHRANTLARQRANPEQYRARQATLRADPKRRQRDRESSARWRAENPERARATLAAYRARPENRERLREYIREWRLAHPEKRREYSRRREARKRQMRGGGTIRRELLAAKLAYWGGCCWIAGPNCTVVPDQWDHVKPLSKGGPHLLANLRPACNRCNSSKKARWPFPLIYAPARRAVVAC
jgi:5-methylcytosine-specific restriction endonuclease McrA